MLINLLCFLIKPFIGAECTIETRRDFVWFPVEGDGYNIDAWHERLLNIIYYLSAVPI